jgi:iron complex transport system permease protein
VESEPVLSDISVPAAFDVLPDPAVDDFHNLGWTTRRRRAAAWVVGLVVMLAVTIVLAFGIGPAPVRPSVVIEILSHHVLGWPKARWSPTQNAIVWKVRAPRVLLGVVVGAGLSATGVGLQALVRNVLADPYLLGVTSGASTGAAAAILFGFGSGFGSSSVSGSAFCGALFATGLVFLMARTGGQLTSIRILLAGVAVGYILYATTSFLVFASGSAEGAQSVLFWLLGSLALGSWSTLGAVTVAVAITIAMLMLWGRHLDALSIGDESALSLGVSPSKLRLRVLVVVALGTGAMVAVSGSIGFIGLVVPHVARRLVGGSHRLVVPVAALIGATFLVWADVVARMALRPKELPIGIVTAFFGAPFLLLLIRRFRVDAM